MNALLQLIILDLYQSRYNLQYPQVSVLPDTSQSRTQGSSILYLPDTLNLELEISAILYL